MLCYTPENHHIRLMSFNKSNLDKYSSSLSYPYCPPMVNNTVCSTTKQITYILRETPQLGEDNAIQSHHCTSLRYIVSLLKDPKKDNRDIAALRRAQRRTIGMIGINEHINFHYWVFDILYIKNKHFVGVVAGL